MDLRINSNPSKPIRRIKIPLAGTNSLMPKGRRTDILDLEDLYTQEKANAPVRAYGTITYQSPLISAPQAIQDKSGFFIKSATPLDHLATFKPHLARLLGFDRVRDGYQEVLQVVSNPNTLDFADPTKFCANIYGSRPTNFVACDSESSSLSDYVFLVYSTELHQKGANIYGSVFSYPSFDSPLVSRLVYDYAVSVGNDIATFGYYPIDRFPIDKAGLPFNNGHVYLYMDSLLTIFPKDGYARDCLYNSYKLVKVASTDFTLEDQLDDNC